MMGGVPASPHPSVRVDGHGHVATVTIDRPESRNACTGDMWVALGAIFQDLRYSGARAVVLTGAKGEFCSGADLTGAGEDGEGGATSDTSTRSSLSQALEAEALAQSVNVHTDDVREAMMAWFERRTPRFTGR